MALQLPVFPAVVTRVGLPEPEAAHRQRVADLQVAAFVLVAPALEAPDLVVLALPAEPPPEPGLVPEPPLLALNLQGLEVDRQ